MSREAHLSTVLTEALRPSYLRVENESSNHNVPKGAETHFKVVVVSSAFDALGKVARHQLVYGALKDEMKRGLHALSIVAKTPSEWELASDVPKSPPCLGGEQKAKAP